MNFQSTTKAPDAPGWWWRKVSDTSIAYWRPVKAFYYETSFGSLYPIKALCIKEYGLNQPVAHLGGYWSDKPIPEPLGEEKANG